MTKRYEGLKELVVHTLAALLQKEDIWMIADHSTPPTRVKLPPLLQQVKCSKTGIEMTGSKSRILSTIVLW